MHSLWSDGDDYPELVAARFNEAGYHFIAFTEHDRFQEGEPPSLTGRAGGAAHRTDIGLKSLAEYRDAVEEHGRFLILNGEEVTVHCRERRHWINVINGDFYASTGVALAELGTSSSGISLKIEQAAGVNHTTRFIGTRRGAGVSGQPVVDANGVHLHTTKEYTKDVGAILKQVEGVEATFELTGEEAYVRALVMSDCPHPCATMPGDVMKAWTQPVCPGAFWPGSLGAHNGASRRTGPRKAKGAVGGD